jgi:predicted CXXCH cytochrome family protein
VLAVALAGACLLLVFVGRAVLLSGRSGTDSPPPLPAVSSFEAPRVLATGGRLTVWWDALPPALQTRALRSGEESNVHPADYAGPDSCKGCHRGNYEAWSAHPHRWMNARADEATVKGDFGGRAGISYRGGRAEFVREGGKHLMRLERGGVRRAFEVTQTIGSRFFQYYVGRQVEGPEPPEHRFYREEHVLHFGWWLDREEWVPVVHIGPEVADDERPDPFDPPESGIYYAEYASSCNSCHTTFPLGDQLARRTQLVGEHAPLRMHWSVAGYLREARPEALDSVSRVMGRPDVPNPMLGWDAASHAVTLGVSCEACHLGARAHVESRGQVAPKFFPTSPHLFVEAPGPEPDVGRSHANVNWACGRCHTGTRPRFAAGMSTWNSVEYSDAMLGGCYPELRCIDCHNPHRAIGPKWSLTAEQDDALCLKCHPQLKPTGSRQRHTHHPAGSEGSRCMNCHMPRLNEGLQDVVRTHMIHSPTRADMIEANHPNACNLCHTDRPIDWTLRHLKEWYGKGYGERKVAAAYPQRGGPVAAGWLRSDNPAVRLVAIDAVARAGGPTALPHLIDALDDSHLVNRQFASRRLEERLNVRLPDLGYRFYMTRDERRGPLAEVRKRLVTEPMGR